MSEQYPSIRIEPDELSIHRSIILSICIAWTIWSVAQGAIYIGILKENISTYVLANGGHNILFTPILQAPPEQYVLV